MFAGLLKSLRNLKHFTKPVNMTETYGKIKNYFLNKIIKSV